MKYLQRNLVGDPRHIYEEYHFASFEDYFRPLFYVQPTLYFYCFFSFEYFDRCDACWVTLRCLVRGLGPCVTLLAVAAEL